MIVVCPECGGSGEVPVDCTCDVCWHEGTMAEHEDFEPCQECEGEGEIEVER